MPYLSYAKEFQGVADVFLRDAARYRPLLLFIEVVMTGESEIGKAEREVLAGYVSRLNGCGFCVGAHRATLDAMGSPSETIAAIDTTPQLALVDDKMKALLALAESLTRDPANFSADDIAKARDAGWSEQAVEDAINVIALFGYVNRLVEGMGIEGNPAYFSYVGKALATQGYTPLLAATDGRGH